MKCPLCEYPYLKKARLDVYWCNRCKKAWLIHKLSSYKTFEEASELYDEAKATATFAVPPKERLFFQ